MSNVFLSYRRGDSPDSVKLIHGRLVARLRNCHVFYDHDSIELGDVFPDVLRHKVTTAGVVLVVIGPKWVELLQQRRDAAVDFVREEVRLALAGTAAVIPVLVGGAAMPTMADLADFPDLQPLLLRDAQTVRPDPLFDAECDKLLAHLERTGPAEIVGSVLAGKYKVQRQIGEGGMGDVFVAEQTNPVRRLVAVKLIKPGMDSKDVLARFDAERQALAVMDHPNVCKVLDAGTAANGRPFFVMEYVKGVPITQFCDERKLPPKARLDLFMTVCRGVQHAHQKGIIHRDLKPGNVLVEVVDGHPVPKVIDFGLAKALGQKLTDKSFIATEYGRWVGTLEYSSPEQAEGRFDIDTLSDVYSLGVLLYELLVGSPPFTRAELQRASEEEMRRVIKEVEPAKPSHRLSSSQNLPAIAANRQLDPAALAKSLRGDLDWIVMKALDKTPEQRYATATALAEDVARHLTDQPIAAGKPSTWRGVQKFARRHRGPVIAAGAVVVALVLGVAGTGWGYFTAKRAEQRAKNEAALKDEQKQLAERNAIAERLAHEKVESGNKELDAKIASLAIATQYAADAAFAENRTARAKAILREIPIHLRGFERQNRLREFSGSYATLYGHTSLVTCVNFNPDGTLIVSGSLDQGLWLWDATTGHKIRSFDTQTRSRTFAKFSPNGSRVISGSGDTVRIWDTITGEEILALKGHTGYVCDASFSPDGSRIASSGSDRTIKLWDAKTGHTIYTQKTTVHYVEHLDFSPDGNTIAGGMTSGRITLRDAGAGQEISNLRANVPEFSPLVTAIAFSPDGSRLISGSGDNTVKVWDAVKWQELPALSGHTGRVSCAAFSPDGTRIVSGSSDHTLKVWDVTKARELRTLKGHTSGVNCVAFSPDGTRIVSGSLDGTLKLWNADAGPEARVFRGHTDKIMGAAFSPDGATIASGSYDSTIKMWSSTTGQELRTLQNKQGIGEGTKFTSDGSYIVSRLNKDRIAAWNTATGKELFATQERLDAMASAAFDYKDRYTIEVGEFYLITIRDANTGREISTLKGHTGPVTCVAFSPDGSRVVIGSKNQVPRIWNPLVKEFSLRIWDTATGRELRTLKGHTDEVTCAMFSPDGSRIVSGSYDTTLRLWDASTGQELNASPDQSWLDSENPKHPTKDWWLHHEGDIAVVIDLNLGDRELAMRRGESMFTPALTNDGYKSASTLYAKAFWKSRFAFHIPADEKHWAEFKAECQDPATWRLMRQTCDLVLQRGPSKLAVEHRAWAVEQLQK